MKSMMTDKKFKINGQYFAGYSKKALENIYPGGGYEVCGEVGPPLKKVEPIETNTEMDSTLPVYPLNSYGKTYAKAGYLLIDEEQEKYVLVRKSKLWKMILSTLAGLALLAGLIFGIWYWLNAPKIDGGAMAYDYKIEKPEGWDPTKILVPGYSDWIMEAGTDKVTAALFNPDSNPCYFQFKVTRDDTDEVLFETDLVPPGSAVTEIDLPEKLKKGIYNITVEVKSYDLEDSKTRLNGAEVKTKIVAREITEEKQDKADK